MERDVAHLLRHQLRWVLHSWVWRQTSGEGEKKEYHVEHGDNVDDEEDATVYLHTAIHMFYVYIYRERERAHMPENIVQITSQLTAWPWQQATAHAAETPFLFPSVASQGSLAEDSGLVPI